MVIDRLLDGRAALPRAIACANDQTAVGVIYALHAGALPFLPGEVIKIALVMLAASGLELARQSR